MKEISYPQSGEFAAYYQKYIEAVPQSGPMEALERNRDELLTLLSTLTEDQANRAYAPGKWTLKQLLGHLIDSERVFSYRALRIARADETPLPGFEQDDYVANGDFNDRRIDELMEEYELLRDSTIALFNSFPEKALTRKGTASTYPVSVRALIWITAGHEQHHLGVMKERYLKVLN